MKVFAIFLILLALLPEPAFSGECKDRLNITRIVSWIKAPFKAFQKALERKKNIDYVEGLVFESRKRYDESKKIVDEKRALAEDSEIYEEQYQKNIQYQNDIREKIQSTYDAQGIVRGLEILQKLSRNEVNFEHLSKAEQKLVEMTSLFKLFDFKMAEIRAISNNFDLELARAEYDCAGAAFIFAQNYLALHSSYVDSDPERISSLQRDLQEIRVREVRARNRYIAVAERYSRSLVTKNQEKKTIEQIRGLSDSLRNLLDIETSKTKP